MSILLGSKALKSLALAKDALGFYQAKLGVALFRGDQEQAHFTFTQAHYDKFHQLPTIQTLEAQFPELKELECPEPPAYYVDQLEARFAYDTWDEATKAIREKLKANPLSGAEATALAEATLGKIKQHQYRSKILNVGEEAPQLLLTTYHGNVKGEFAPAFFGWPYLDLKGGILPGEVASIVGRPATGKTYKNLKIALYNWHSLAENVLFVSMEMGKLAIAQRIGAMYAHTNVSQLKVGGYSTKTFKIFVEELGKMQKEPAKLYVVDSNLGGTAEDIFALASILKCKRIVIDGGYLVRHRDPRIDRDRYLRVAENAEQFKKWTATNNLVTIVSWQFARSATDKMKKKSTEKAASSSDLLDSIGYSDVIGQTSALVLGIMQDEGVETIIKRRVQLLKGREGQVGGFDIHWDFDTMNFDQYGLNELDKKQEEKDELDFV
jgi:replicative DNA helicase